MIKRRIVFILTCYVALTLFACTGGAKYSSWKAKGVDLKKYKTYAWVAPGDSSLNTRRDDKLFAGTILSASNEELAKKGMVLKSENPDAVFMFDTRVQNETRYSQAPTVSMGVGFGGPGYYVGGMAPVAGGQISAIPYQEGTLIIEMFDVQTKQVIWRGTAMGAIDNSTDVEALIRKSCRDIFFYLPIKHKS